MSSYSYNFSINTTNKGTASKRRRYSVVQRDYHNELERRRRQLISSKFTLLQHALPENAFPVKTNMEKVSRCSILNAACRYMSSMETKKNATSKDIFVLETENELLKKKIEILEKRSELSKDDIYMLFNENETGIKKSGNSRSSYEKSELRSSFV